MPELSSFVYSVEPTPFREHPFAGSQRLDQEGDRWLQAVSSSLRTDREWPEAPLLPVEVRS